MRDTEGNGAAEGGTERPEAASPHTGRRLEDKRREPRKEPDPEVSDFWRTLAGHAQKNKIIYPKQKQPKQCPGCRKFSTKSQRLLAAQIKFDPLSQRYFTTPVDRIGLSTHICFPGIRSTFATAACLFFTSEGAANLRT